jgi:tetratricopeptide (TPR) repeat protein
MINKDKLKKFLVSPYTVSIAFFIFFVAVYFHFYYDSASALVKEANNSYLEGERAQTVDVRKTSFNRALNAFLKLEDEYDPRFGNGILYYDIGNTYYQLENYPRAVLYYYRAQNLRPFDENVRNNLNIVLKKLHLPADQETTPLEMVFFFHSVLPLPWRLQLFFFTAFSMLILGSLYIWSPSNRIKITTTIFGAVAATMLLSLTFTYFVENPNGVIVKATNIYRGASEQFAPITDEPIKPGTKITVTQIEQNGEWLKISTPDGEVGFIPSASLLLIF